MPLRVVLTLDAQGTSPRQHLANDEAMVFAFVLDHIDAVAEDSGPIGPKEDGVLAGRRPHLAKAVVGPTVKNEVPMATPRTDRVRG